MIDKASKSLISQVQLLHQKKFRKKLSLSIIEGEKLIEEAMMYYPEGIEYLIVDSGLLNQLSENYHNFKVYSINRNDLNKMSLDRTPSGLIAVIRQKKQLNIEKKNLLNTVVILNQISDPGNLGTILRTCEAFNVSLVASDFGTVEFSNPKVIRSSMGSYFRQKFIQVEDKNEMIEVLIENKYQIFALSLQSNKNIFKYQFPQKTAFVIGNESHGISKEIAQKVQTLKIPMYGKNESFNAAISCSVSLTVLEMQKNWNKA